MPSFESALRSAIATRLDEYFAALGRSGEVNPAARYRLEGFLQAGLVSGILSQPELNTLVSDHINAFNSDNERQLVVLDDAWRLPYLAPLAPVK
ncbi:MAG: hypothetical protein HKO71_07820 [Pseudomonadales bacterium]|nr:hypothetical protein [Pseudomonadales bacterium]